ncbi:uncharacterized protein EDB93DRAFT_1108244 [Suillus bovinus]|uniref:uncharacterized protein n=1 Tax=Suillus bovinus TaxID=48563 RepID=UPI001B8737B7|nr:uncharacterized protein EDB93DRAFT_1108244 [Suillus bovinus]KAG2130951.1 hypothetical protein EDB93DRAFT_1108244 [Suillus bovinus]
MTNAIGLVEIFNIDSRLSINNVEHVSLEALLSIIDITSYFACFLDFVTVHKLSLTCKSIRQIIANLHEKRFFNLLKPYMMTAGGDLAEAIEDNNAVIVGSAALSLIWWQGLWKPRDLNIVTARGNAVGIGSFLLSNGFISETEKEDEKEIWSSAFVSSHHQFTHSCRKQQRITITKSVNETIITVILASIGTSEMIPSQLEEVLETKKALAIHPIMSGGRQAALFARDCDRALLVPVPLMVRIDELETTDDLHTF